MTRRASAGVVAGCAMVLALFTTGGASPVQRSRGGAIPQDHPRVAMMPFENLSGREDQAQVFTRIFFAQLVSTGSVDVVDPVEVDQAMDALRIRATGSMTAGQLRAIADTLHTPYVMLGSVLESATLQDPDGAIPSVGASLRMVEAATGRVAWAAVLFRSGGDRETVFGWGRVRSTEKLVMELAQAMLKDFRDAGRSNHASRTENRR